MASTASVRRAPCRAARVYGTVYGAPHAPTAAVVLLLLPEKLASTPPPLEINIFVCLLGADQGITLLRKWIGGVGAGALSAREGGKKGTRR